MSKKTTRAERQSSKHLIPEKIEVPKSAPTLIEQAHNNSIDFYTRHLKNSAKNAKKGSEIFQRLLDDMHTCTDKKNLGKVEEVYVENPSFDPSKPDSEENPFLIKTLRHMYDPMRYKENTYISVSKDAMSDSKEYIRQVQQFEKEARIAKRQADKAVKEMEKVQTNTYENTPLISIDFEESDTVN